MSLRDDFDEIRGALLCDGPNGNEWVGALERVEARVAALTQALEEFANPQHWGISREFRDPAFIWIGTYQQSPVEFAQAALRVEQERDPPPA